MREDIPAGAGVAAPIHTEENPSNRNSYFRSVSSYWEKLYQDENLTARIYQERKQIALRWVEDLSLPPGTRVLDLGCGAGYTAVALAERGYHVDALDGEQAMLDMTSRRAQAAGVALTTELGDAHELKFDPGTFDLVIALGLIPWLHSPHQALSEMRRVLKPGGFLVVSSDNRRRLVYWLDPIYNPWLVSWRNLVTSVLRKKGWMRVPHTTPLTMQSTGEFDRLLDQAGFKQVKSATIGFGPFTLFRRDVLPDRWGIKLHEWLQRHADAGRRMFRKTGAHYLVAATHPAVSIRHPRSATQESYDVSTPVVVLGANTHGSLGIMRSLGRMGVPMHAVCSPPRGPASFSTYCQSTTVWDFAHAEPRDTISFLLDLAQRIGKRCILIPTWDEMAVFTAEFHDRLKAGFICPEQPVHLPRSLCSKKEMAVLARRFGVPTPEVAFPRSLQDVLQYIETARFPVMLKGIDGNLLKARTGKKMAIVYSPRQLQEMYLALENPEEPNVMLQEYIPGGDDSIWMFNGYFNARSECLVGFTGRKLRQTPIHTGMTSLGICLRNDVVEKTTKDLMRALGYKGILDIGYRYDARDGEYKVLDINPRIGATFRLFVADNGMDVARALYLDLTGQQVPPSRQREGRKWFVELDLKSCIDYHREGSLTLLQWLRSLQGIEEAGYFAWDDPAPFRKLCFKAASTFMHHASHWAKGRFRFGRSRGNSSLGPLTTLDRMDSSPATEQSEL
jgi:predicted ATP-grasp superfamily ATP-dependent carboligase/ubiquinone/menaquinone biosynthesis C-methylase UbiE